MATARSSGLVVLAAAGAMLGTAERHLVAQPAPARSSACRRQVIGPLVANVPSVEVRPQFRLNGKPFPGTHLGVAMFTLWASRPSDLFDGPQLSLGQTDAPPPPVRVVPGVYDVYYSWQSGPFVPRNTLTRILRNVAIRSNRVLTIDVPMISVGGVKHHNGLPFAEDGGAAKLSLRRADSWSDVPLGGILPTEFSLRIIPGTYALLYDWNAGRTIPRNRYATVRQLRLLKDTPNLILSVPSVVQDFVFLHNGAPFPSAAIEHGDIVLRRPDKEEVEIGSTHEPPLPVRLIPGTYDAHWQYRAGAAVPRNEDARFRRGLVVAGSPLVIDLPSVEISGDIRLNGQIPPGSAIENARLSLAVRNRPDRVDLGQTRYGAYQTRVVPGLYDVVYEHLAGGAIMPANSRATFIRGWKVAAQPHRTIDIPVGTYEGAFFLNGESFPYSDIESGRLDVLPLSHEGSPTYLSMTSYGQFSRRLIPGRYRAAYNHLAGASVVPANAFTTFGAPGRVLQGDGPPAVADTLDVRAATLTVSYEHNGVPLAQGGAQNARVHLYRDGNYLQLIESFWGPADRIAMEGRFDLYYQYRGGPDLPQNVFMPFGCWDLVR